MKSGKKKGKTRKVTQAYVSRPNIRPGIVLDMFRDDPSTFPEVSRVFHFLHFYMGKKKLCFSLLFSTK